MSFYHHLKLFSTDPEVVAGTKILLNERYDELVRLFLATSLILIVAVQVFQEPSDLLLRLLNCAKSLAAPTDENLAIEKECRRLR